MKRPVNKKRTVRGVEKCSDGVWVRLPESVVEARAGLIPSYETDANPPPEDLTSDELRAWHRGIPVPLRAKQLVQVSRWNLIVDRTGLPANKKSTI